MSDTIVKSLLAKYSLDSSGFKKGSADVKKELTELNKAMFENKDAMKAVNADMKALEKEQKAYEKAVKEGKEVTDEETKAYNDNREKLEALALKKAQLKTEEFEIKNRISQTNSALKEQGTTAKDLEGNLQKTVLVFLSLATALKTVKTLAKAAYEQLIMPNAVFEGYETAFTTTIGSAEKAKQLVEEINVFAAKTPLKAVDLLEQAKILQAYGISVDNIVDKLRQLGDLSMGNKEKMQQITTAYGKMVATNSVNLRYLNQIIAAGVPILRELSTQLGVSKEELRKMISSGKVTVEDLDNAIVGLTSDNGQFAGTLEAQSRTMSGMLSTLGDKLDLFKRQIGEKSFKQLSGEIEKLMNALDKALEDGTLDSIAEDLGNTLNSLVTTLINLAKWGWENKNMIVAFGAALLSFKVAVSVANAISAVVVTIRSFTKATEGATAAQAALNVVQMANPYVMVAGVLSGLIGGLVTFSAMSGTATQKVKDLNTALKDLNSELEPNEKLTQNLSSRYEELIQKTNRTVQEEQELKNVIAELNRLYPDKLNFIDEETGKYQSLEEQIRNVVQAMKDEAEAELISENYKKALQEQKEAQEKLDVYWTYLSPNEKHSGLGTSLDNSEIYTEALINGRTRAYGDYVEQLHKVQEATAKVKEYENAYANLLKTSTDLSNSTKNYTSDLESLEDETSDLSSDYSNLLSTLEQVNAKQAVLSATEKEYSETQNITDKNLKSIVEKYPQLSTAVDNYLKGISTGKQLIEQLRKAYKDDENAYRNLVIAKMDTDENLYNSILNSHKQLTFDLNNTCYSLDLSNYKNLAQAKYAVEQTLVSACGSLWLKYYDVQKGVWKDAYNHAGGSSQGVTEQQKAIYQTVQAYENAVAQLNSFALLVGGLNTSSITTGGSGYSGGSSSAGSKEQKEVTALQIANEAYKKLVEDRINLINKRTEEEEKARNKRIKAIDDEIEAHKRLRADNEIDKKIEAAEMQLKYAHLDEFSRKQLEKQIKSLKEQKKETEWERAKADEKAQINSNYENFKTQQQNLINRIKNQSNYANQLFSDLQNGFKSAQSIVKNNSTVVNQKIVTDNLTANQITRAVIEYLGGNDIL